METNNLETDADLNINENVKYNYGKDDSDPLAQKLFNRFKVRPKSFRFLANKKNYFVGRKNLFSKRNSSRFNANSKYAKYCQYNRYIWARHSTDEHYEDDSKNVQLVFAFNRELY